MTSINSVYTHVHGTLTLEAGEVLRDFASRLPDDAKILDLSAGEGRSSIILAGTLCDTNNVGSYVLSVDTHVRNVLSDRPHEEGSIMAFLQNCRHFDVLHRITALIAAPRYVTMFFGKRSVNMVVAQTPDIPIGALDVLCDSIEVSKSVIRVGGYVCFVQPAFIPGEVFNGLVRERFDVNFSYIGKRSGVIIYQYVPKKGDDDATKFG